ncbi:MAG: hypothetical protein ABEI31_02370, partial [Halodesulfurarchaeum sp.]
VPPTTTIIAKPDPHSVMELGDLQSFLEAENRRLLETLDGLTRENIALAQTVKLSEEVGELSRAILACESLQRERKEGEEEVNQDVAGELADVVITTFLLAESVDVDVEDELEQKVTEIEERYE